MKEKIGVTLELEDKMRTVLEYLAIRHGVTIDEMFENCLSEGLEKLGIETPKPEIETKEEFEKMLRVDIQEDALKKHILTEWEIETLKKAYYFSTMAEKATVPQPKPHDKKRYKKYENALHTIEEMLSISKHADSEYLLKALWETYDILITSRADLKRYYKQKMHEEINKINISNYAKKKIIETFKNSF